MTFPPKVWDGVLRRIQPELPAYSIATWLLPLVPETGDKGELRLLCPSTFHRDRVRDRYLDTISACLQQEVGKKAVVTLGLESVKSGKRARAVRLSPLRGPERAKHRTAIDANSGDARLVEPDLTQPGLIQPDLVQPDSMDTTSIPPRSGGPRPLIGPTGAAARPSDDERRATAEPAARSQLRRARPASQRLSQRGGGPTFDNFVVGSCNSLAREASIALANESRGLRQLYLAAPHGLGKTHLSRAVVAEARRQDSARVLYASSEAFTSEFMSSIQNKKTSGFKQRWRRECDVLVIEDIQFLVGKRATQLELFHTVQHVLDRGRRVLLTGDRPAHELSGLDERVRSQLAGGFTATIEQPNAAVRCDILRAKASAGGVGVPEDCLALIVQSVPGSIRELEGALIQIVTTASLMKRSIDLELTRESLERTTPRPTRPRPTPEAIVKAVASFFQTTAESLASRSRRRDILVPRQLAMYFCHRYTDASLGQIGHALGRNHPSVRNAISQVERSILERAPLRYKVEALSERLDQLGLGDRPEATPSRPTKSRAPKSKAPSREITT